IFRTEWWCSISARRSRRARPSRFSVTLKSFALISAAPLHERIARSSKPRGILRKDPGAAWGERLGATGWNYRAFGRERGGQEHLATGDMRNDRLAWGNPVQRQINWGQGERTNSSRGTGPPPGRARHLQFDDRRRKSQARCTPAAGLRAAGFRFGRPLSDVSGSGAAPHAGRGDLERWRAADARHLPSA